MSRVVRRSKEVIDSMYYTISKYPRPEGYISVGGDSVYTDFPQVQEFLEVLRLARLGLTVEGEAAKNIPVSWRAV